MSNPPPLPETLPDRLFARAALTAAGGGLALIFAGYVAVHVTLGNQSATAERALLSASAAASARSAAATLAMIAPDAMPGLRAPGAADAARLQFAWDVDRFAKNAAPEVVASAAVADFLAEAQSFTSDPAAGPDGYDGLGRTLIQRVIPTLILSEAEARGAAVRAATTSQRVLGAAFLLQLLGGAAIVAGVLRPARRQIGAWVAQSRETEMATRFRLLHDDLTGLPNPTYLHAFLGRLAAGAERSETQTAVLRVNLDRFSVVRETLGSRASDEIVRVAARRIQHAMRPGDFAAYLGQDDFVVVAVDLEDANTAAQIANRIQSALALPVSLRGGPRQISACIGVTLMSDDVPEPERALGNAAIALAEAQGIGTGTVRYFRESLRVEVERRATLYTELLAGLDRGELVPFFQPQIDLATGEFAGFEALVRWHHPRGGLLAPAAFLDFADQTDLTERIGEVVLAAALEALCRWDAVGLAVPKVGVNFALAQLRDPRLIEKIKWEVERYDIDPSRLAIEVLETVLIKSDADMVVRNLRGLASAGFRIELDDFGTGHASISNLRRFMVDRVKIDRSFIFGIETSVEQQQLTASMIALARTLGIATLAEGVETEAAERTLRGLGCNFLQGYLVAKPMSLDDTFGWLQAFQPRACGGPDADPARWIGDPNIP